MSGGRIIKCIFLALCLLSVAKSVIWAQTPPDSIATERELPVLEVTPRPKPFTPEERAAMWRRIRDVKKVMPYARYIATTIIETYEYMETLPTEQEQEKHLQRVQRELKVEMEPKMRKLTLRQGRLLIKLINRQTGQTSYELVKAVLGSFKAWYWSVFAKVFGASLVDTYDPKLSSEDFITERIIEELCLGRL